MAYLQGVQQTIRSWFLATRPPLVDTLVAAAFVALTVVEAFTSPGSRSTSDLVIAALAMAALAWRRVVPIAVAGGVVLANLLTNPQGDFTTLLSLVLVSFTVGSECDRPRSHIGLTVVLVPFVGAMAVEGLEPSDLAAAMVFLVGPWGVGVLLRQRTARAAEAMARAELAERQRVAEAAAAAQAERTRIARELHDIVSHSISVVAIQTQAVRKRLGPDHEREAADLAAVEATARDALAEMRRLFGVLRSAGEGASLAPQPGLAELPRLVEQASSPGLVVELEVTGTPYELPPGLDLAAYRILQEGLTNALRHSGAATVAVRLGYGPNQLDLAVEDDGRGTNGSGPTTGHGLVGVRERVALYDGWVGAGPLPGGGYRLAATLPVGDRP